MPPSNILDLPMWLQTVFVGLMIAYLSNDWTWLNTLKPLVKNSILVLIAVAVGGIVMLVQRYLPVSELSGLQPLWDIFLLALAAIGAFKVQGAIQKVWRTFQGHLEVQAKFNKLMAKALDEVTPELQFRMKGYVTDEEFRSALEILHVRAQGAGQVVGKYG